MPDLSVGHADPARRPSQPGNNAHPSVGHADLGAPPARASYHSPSTTSLEALFALLSSLKRHDVIAIDKLAERLGVDPAGLRHDLELLRYVGEPPFGGGDLLPLEIDEDGYLEVTGAMPALDRPLRLSFEQALALVLALEIAGYAPDDALVEKLSRAARDDTGQLDVDQLARQVRAQPTGLATAIFETVTQALTRQRALRIDYRRDDGTVSDRVIEPYLLFAEGDRWYITAFCHLRGRTQNFRLDRIESAQLEPETNPGPGQPIRSGKASVGRVDPDAPSVPTGVDPGPGRGDNARHSPAALRSAGLPLAHLRFADARLFVQREWPGARVTSRANGALEADVPYATGSSAWFTRHVAAGAGQITVMFPAEARTLVRAYAQRQLSATVTPHPGPATACFNA